MLQCLFLVQRLSIYEEFLRVFQNVEIILKQYCWALVNIMNIMLML